MCPAMATAAFTTRLHAELEAGATDVRRTALERALRDPRLTGRRRGGLGRGVAVFRAAGREFGGVAAAHRRRVAAWPETAAAADPDARTPRGEGCVDAALDAIAAAVNSAATAEPVE